MRFLENGKRKRMAWTVLNTPPMLCRFCLCLVVNIHYSLSINCDASRRVYIFSKKGTSTKSIAPFITASVLCARASLARASGFVSAFRIGQFW